MDIRCTGKERHE